MKAIVCEGYTEAKEAGPGAIFKQTDSPLRLAFFCPCGCGALLGAEEPGWKISGFPDAITVSPSILHMDGCKWHGWLTNGEWREA